MMKYFKNSNDEVFAFEQDGSQDDLITADLVSISNEEAKQLANTGERQIFESFSYQEKRSISYPSIGDQLDAIWKGGAAAAEMLAKVQAVKDKYPKPTGQ